MKKHLLLFFILLVVFSCGKIGRMNEFSKESATYELEENSEDISAGTKDKSETADEKKSAPMRNKISPDTEKPIDNRKIIKNGSISYQVKELENIENIVEKKVKEFGGYIASSNFNVNSISISVKIPSEKFEDFLKEANSFGKITNKSISAQDVTKEYFDLEGRIKNIKIRQERIRSYISYANNIDELILLESELNRVTDELESLEGNYKNLSHLIAFSTLNMDFYNTYLSEITRKWPSIKNELNSLGYFIVIFLFNLFKYIIYFIIISIPLILILGGIYFLTFGKLGYVKKMFKILSGESSKKASRK